MGLFGKKNQGGMPANIAEAIQNEKKKADVIVNAIDDGVVLVDAQNIIKTFNPAAEGLSGWDREEAQEIDYRSVLKLVDGHGQLVEDSAHPFYRAFQSGKTVRDNNLSIVRRDNRQIAVDVSATPIIGADGSVNGAVAVLRNVDEQRRQEQQRADFISTASHEMRTPVAAIEGYLALALNENVSQIDAKARSYLEKAHSSTKHLGQLFQDLLTSAKAEDGRLISHPQKLNLSDFVEKLIEDLRFTAAKKNLKLELKTSANDSQNTKTTILPLYFVWADPDRLREVITNLFDNAVKYTDEGKITVSITGNDTVVQLAVADTGPGIPREDLPHLFQKFYRVDNSATRTVGGTGLGLFISKKIIDLYNGQIWAESDLGQGSTFYINLPRINS